MKKSSFLILIFLFSTLTIFGQDNENVQGSWSGFIRYTAKTSGQLGSSEITISLAVNENKVTGSHIYDATDILHNHHHCEVVGKGLLKAVSVRTFNGTYDIGIQGPECTGADADPNGAEIGIANKKLLPKNGKFEINELSGTEVRESDVGGDLGKTIYKTTWNLTRDLDVKLVVTPKGFDKENKPKDYDDWLPEPGKDETNKGSYMKIELSLKSKSGKPLQYKAQSFELRLSNTSTEPGITINYPIEPRPDQLPDLRFIPLPVAESDAQDQYITVSCNNGTTGEAFIGSYDGGGATTLTVEATLVGGIRISGQLSGSNDDSIQIPKRVAGTMIATKWLTDNGNPNETDDKDTSVGNKNDGDGLTAYEEYRGVISEAEFSRSNPVKFGRLDPHKKEVGVRIDKKEMSLFSEGIKWFEKVSNLRVIRFNETEILNNRRFNKNANTAHIYNQYVLILYKGLVPGALGSIYSWDGKPNIPANTFNTVIDIDAITNEYNYDVNKERPTALPFTLSEFIANVVAHELGHGVNAWHHGQKPDLLSPMAADDGPPFLINGYNGNTGNWVLLYPPSIRIFNRSGAQLSLPYTMKGVIGQSGNTESGDLGCIMAYVPYCNWARTIGADGAWIFNEVPMLDVGRKMCTSPNGTSINTSIAYFGNAVKGNCLSQIKLK